MIKYIHASFAALAFLSVTSSYATDRDPITLELKTTLQSRLDEMTVKDISKSVIPGLYEVNVGSHILYSDAKGDYIVVGDLMSTKTHKNLTQARLSDINRIDFDKLPL
ncbi:hypothetical protein R69746_08816 [Paraburkholderia aspalathi]|nr:hypothetical protein R75465_08582 [Paraburkholderia aspalathi]CAE6876622.1 hypothetical protein R69746_08816 [Paraburkholderia aspalathi]